MGVVVFIRVRCVHWGTPLGSSGSFGVLGFNQQRPGGRWVLWRSHLGSSRSFEFVGFIRARPFGRLFYSGSLVSFGRTLSVEGFTHVRPRDRSVHSGALSESFGFVGFFQARYSVHSDRTWCHRFHSGSFGFVWFVGFISVWPARGRVHFGSLGSFRGFIGLIRLRPGRSVVQSSAP